MKSEEILLVGVKCNVLAFEKVTGRQLWSAKLNSGLFVNQSFVSLIADNEKVYAHVNGILFCLDLFTGAELWRNGLAGCGYGMASLAVAGLRNTESVHAAQESAEHRRRSSAS